MAIEIGDTFPVYFASNRNYSGTDNNPEFGNRFHQDGPRFYRVGKAVVEKQSDDLDEGYKVAKLVRAVEGKRKKEADKLGSTEIFNEIKQCMIDEKRDVIIYIHGFANSFDNALVRAAQLHEQYVIEPKRSGGAPYHPIVFAFCWPSDGQTQPPWKYSSDRDDARESGPAMARAIMRFIDFMNEGEPCKQRVHVVAHSMGNWALRHAIQGLKELMEGRNLPTLFDNVFLMAADEDEDTLEIPLKLQPLGELARRIHVYHSNDDLALVISDTTKFNPDRLGFNGPRTFTGISNRVVAIDCENVDDTEMLQANHQYYRRRPEVIADVRQVLAGERPDQIDGREVIEPGKRFRIKAPEKAEVSTLSTPKRPVGRKPVVQRTARA